MYSYWRTEVINQYKTMESLSPLIDQFIIDHKQLADGVYQTTYEDGSRVIVNYTQYLYQVDDQTVPAQDFIVTPGD